jgi:hypothetical protein
MTYEFPLLDRTLFPSLYPVLVVDQRDFSRLIVCFGATGSDGRGRHLLQICVDSVLREAGPSDHMSVFDRLEHCRFRWTE